jgi:hypothetical protein
MTTLPTPQAPTPAADTATNPELASAAEAAAGLIAETAAQRPPVKAPENHQAAPEHAATMPPPPRVPTPPPIDPKALAASSAPAANHAFGGVEMHLARFVGQRIEKQFLPGLQLDVTIVPSNAVTGEGQKGLHDVEIRFTGGALENPEQARLLAPQLRAALREHPAFEGMNFGGLADEQIEHFMRCQILGLEAERHQELLKLQPDKKVTFLADALAAQPTTQEPAKTPCTGAAGCGHCKETGEQKRETPKPHAPKADAAPALALAPDPTTQVRAPVQHHGLAANAPVIEKTA